jgi:O-antigen ligase
VNNRRIIFLFGLWLVVSLFFNDKTNFGAVHLGINIGPDRLVYALFIIEFLRQYGQSGKGVRWIMEEKLMIAFFFILLVSCFLGGGAFVPRNRYLSKLFNFSIVPATLFMVSRRLPYDQRSLRMLWMVLLIVGSYLSFTGVCEHYHLSGLIFPKYILDPNVGIHFDRVRGPFVNSAVMGGVLIVIGVWILWHHFNVGKSWLTWAVLFPILTAGYFTYTREVWLQFAASLLPMTVFPNPLRRPSRWIVFLLVTVYFSGVASKFSAYDTSLFKGRPEQVDDRLNIYYASWRMFLERPLFGFGYGNFLKYSDDYFAELPGIELRGQQEGQHNTILGLMCETGIVGTVPYLLLYSLFVGACYRRLRNPEPAGKLGGSLAFTQFSILAGALVGMQFSDWGFYNYLNDLVFWLTGIVYGNLVPPANDEHGFVASAEQPRSSVEMAQAGAYSED